MKHLLTIAVAAAFTAAFATSSFAGNCGSCPAGGDKAKEGKDKTEQPAPAEGSQS